ncbi:MAG: glutaminase A [Rhodocyclaceae bacterium]|nr:glutaminase A [Rhodocyclaceae bacterium]MBX3668792.1 glutaminase A [Rhodocyclaceae bacterium]
MNPKLLQQALPMQAYLEDLHARLVGIMDGDVASYIPELTRADPNWFGIALVTVDGHVYQAGDSHQKFTIQSISKAITYGLALEDRGLEQVRAKVGVEPSGEAFNSISLEKDTGRPFNPMINAGAIATTGLINGPDWEGKFRRIMQRFEKFTGHPVSMDEEVYRSERDTGHRNRAIAHLLRNANIIEEFPEEIVDLYFRQCSILVTARDLAVMGATLANNGVNPITSVIAQQSQYVDKMLSVMSTCGMYDYSGNWVYSVGMPAKSGVGGGIMAVLPGQFGLGVFSPPLDAKGNSFRGVKVCEQLSRDFGLHLLKVVRATSASVVRVQFDGANVRSRRQRGIAERELLTQAGARIKVYELQGELMFSSTDSLIRSITVAWDDTDYLILDFHRVVDISAASIKLLSGLLQRLASAGKQALLTGTENKYFFRRAVTRAAAGGDMQKVFGFRNTDAALEWCENQLLEARGTGAAPDPAQLLLRNQYLCQDFDADQVACLQTACVLRRFEPGQEIFRCGDAANSLFFVTCGTVDLIVRTSNGRERRVLSVCAGMSFGEFALATGQSRSTGARAADTVECLELRFGAIAADLHPKMMTNLAKELARRLSAEARQLQLLG